MVSKFMIVNTNQEVLCRVECELLSFCRIQDWAVKDVEADGLLAKDAFEARLKELVGEKPSNQLYQEQLTFLRQEKPLKAAEQPTLYPNM